MRRFGLTGSIVVALALLMGTASGVSAASGPVPLTSGGYSRVLSISCAAAGECAAGGQYADSRPFVVSETNGSWGSAIKVPGAGAFGEVESVSCPAAGECVAGGVGGSADGAAHAFVVSETDGSWGSAIAVPGTASLHRYPFAAVTSISCAAPGECAAGGFYGYQENLNLHLRAFVVNETNGSWGSAITVKAGGFTEVSSIACSAVGECAAGGFYDSGQGSSQAFVVSETNGVWSTAIEVPGTAALNAGGDASVDSVFCAAAGECDAGGYYTDGGYKGHAFLASETNGSWGSAIEVPGMATLDAGLFAAVNSISCTAAGECAAGGDYDDGSEYQQAFVVDETNGNWGNAIEVPGTETHDLYGAGVDSISCAAAGECAAGGHYGRQAFVDSETNGSWGNAIKIGATLNTGRSADADAISCTAPGECAAGGFYASEFVPPYFHLRAFTVDETNGSWGDPNRVFPASCVVPNVVGKAIRAAKRKLYFAGCDVSKTIKVGKTLRPYSTVKTGRVVAQQPKPGKYLDDGARVALTVSRRKR